MKKLALLTSVITSINCGIAVGIGAERLTVHLEDLVDNRYIDYKYRSGEFKKRYEDAKRFREYIEATFSKGTLIIEDTKEHRIKHIDAILLKKLCHIESEDNHPEKMMEVILIFSMIDGKPLAFDKRCCCTNWNIPNLLLHFIFQEMFYEGRSYKVILPPDSFELFGNCNYAEKSSIRSFDFRGATTEFVRDMGFMFRNQNSLTSLDLRNFDTSNVTSMLAMFDGCKNLTSLVLSNFNTKNVTRMDGMFDGCTMLTSLNLSNFDTSNVTTMYRMFADCGLTSLDLGNFDTRKVTSMDSMFENCDFLKYLDLSNFNTEKVEGMCYMFSNCKKLKSLNLKNFDTSNVTDIFKMFNGCGNLISLDLSNFDTSNVMNMSSMFEGCTDLSSVSFKENSVLRNSVNMSSMFKNCTSLSRLVLPKLKNIGKVDDIYEGCISLRSAPNGGELPIIQQDLHGAINMIETMIAYPKVMSKQQIENVSASNQQIENVLAGNQFMGHSSKVNKNDSINRPGFYVGEVSGLDNYKFDMNLGFKSHVRSHAIKLGVQYNFGKNPMKPKRKQKNEGFFMGLGYNFSLNKVKIGLSRYNPNTKKLEIEAIDDVLDKNSKLTDKKAEKNWKK